MEKATSSKEAIISTIVEVTPGLLREMATLLELSGQRVAPTETILVRLTERISLSYRPSTKIIEKIKETYPEGNTSPIKPVKELNAIS